MIIFLGASGSGKSTQGKILAEKLNCPWVSTGEILRENLQPEFKKALETGHLVSDDVILPLLKDQLHKQKADIRELIGDGWPRNIVQAKWLDENIKNGSIKLTAIIHLLMKKELAKSRMKQQGRSDGKAEAIDQRFEEYQASVLPALDYLKNLGYKILEIDAAGTVDEVGARVQKTLGLA